MPAAVLLAAVLLAGCGPVGQGAPPSGVATPHAASVGAGRPSAGPTTARATGPTGPASGSPTGSAGGVLDEAAGGTVAPTTPTGWGPTHGEVERARGLAEAMSTAELAATVLMPGFWGYDAARPAPLEAQQNLWMHGVGSAARALAAQPFGGVFLRPEVISDADQVAALTQQLHDAGDQPDGLPLLIGIDQEGGTVQRLSVGVPPVPSAGWVGSTGDRGYARRVARDNGEVLRELGVTMVLAPVADVDPGGVSVLGSRTYSSDPHEVARMVTASVAGYLRAGVVPVVKHFPGIGSVPGDSHGELVVQDKSFDELLDSDLVPFRAAIEAGVPAVMVGHVAVEALAPGLPASVSRDVVVAVLRGTLGFDGVVITDSQGMGPIHGRFGSAEGAVRSLLAGNDLVLNSPRPRRAHRAVVAAVESGRLPRVRLVEAATRVLALRVYVERLAAAGPR